MAAFMDGSLALLQVGRGLFGGGGFGFVAGVRLQRQETLYRTNSSSSAALRNRQEELGRIRIIRIERRPGCDADGPAFDRLWKRLGDRGIQIFDLAAEGLSLHSRKNQSELVVSDASDMIVLPANPFKEPGGLTQPPIRVRMKRVGLEGADAGELRHHHRQGLLLP